MGLDDAMRKLESRDLLERMFFGPELSIDLFTDIPPVILEPLLACLEYAKITKDSNVEHYCYQLMRLLVSVERGGRKEYVEVQARELERLSLERQKQDSLIK